MREHSLELEIRFQPLQRLALKSLMGYSPGEKRHV